MLSPRDDDDDDTHLCIKCNATIVGLDNYVKHRKQRCNKNSKMETSKPSDIPIDNLEPTYSLGADVFFQSLELQSSVKKTSLSRLTPPITISKASDKKTALVVASTSRDVRMSPLQTNLRGEDWIGGHSLRIPNNEDNQTKLINAVASISGDRSKKEIPSTSYNIISYNDYKGDDDESESDDLEDDDEDDTHVSGGKWKPPPNYTGGKWRPASPDQDDWEEQEHTGGKWKLLIPDGNEREEDYDAPPPGHTKGKWVPGAHEKTQIMQTTIQTKGSVQYWCGPCNRRLGSKAIYDKHLMSSLHLKKVLPEHELEFSGHLQPMRNVLDKRTSRPSRFLNDTIYSQLQRKRKQNTDTKLNFETEKKKRRKRKSLFIHCSGCNSRVRMYLMGKHLISHYHFRKATITQSSVYRQLILDNIDAIVHQSPFQCSPCKFYTNWLSNFMQHWFSDEHNQTMSLIDGRCWCSFCKFECDTSQEMLQHMSGSDHSEVIAVINRSMPIIIRKKTIIKCVTCNKNFRYNIEIKRHCQETGHQLAQTATDNYQELHKCRHCKAKFKTSLTLAAHLKSKHKQRVYFCLVCELTFNTSDEAKRHRYSTEHRIKRKEKMKERGLLTKDLSKKCMYCTEKVILKNVLELKAHIREAHPNIIKNCPKCGMSFVLSQEVTRHIRDNACQFQTPSGNSSMLWNCSQCPFVTESRAECFFHEVLHSAPEKETKKVGEKEKVVYKYNCPICQKSFRKASLRHHIRQHTFERPYVCTICGVNFTRQSSLSNHVRNEHETKNPKVTGDVDAETSGKAKNEFKCAVCEIKFSSKSALTRHECSNAAEEKRCSYKDCTFVASSTIKLARHRRSHGEQVKPYQCTLCAFKTDQASHLKRHMVCHQGIKPYGCPHCNFTCGSLENLRKHVLRSGRHPGAALYMCRQAGCVHSSRTAREFRRHLTAAHAAPPPAARLTAQRHLLTEYPHSI